MTNQNPLLWANWCPGWEHFFVGRRQTAPRLSWRKIMLSKGLPDVPDGCEVDVSPAPGQTYTRLTWPPRGRGRGESLTSPRRMRAKFRAVEVVRLRLQEHCTWEEIARRTGFADPSGAYRAMKRALDRIDWDNAERERRRRRRVV